VGADLAQELVRVARLTRDFVPCFREQSRQALAEQQAVLADDYAHGILACTRVRANDPTPPGRAGTDVRRPMVRLSPPPKRQLPP
jgi:hypothetical protein